MPFTEALFCICCSCCCIRTYLCLFRAAGGAVLECGEFSDAGGGEGECDEVALLGGLLLHSAD